MYVLAERESRDELAPPPDGRFAFALSPSSTSRRMASERLGISGELFERTSNLEAGLLIVAGSPPHGIAVKSDSDR